MKRSIRRTLVAVAALTLGVTQRAHAAILRCSLLDGIGVTVVECPTGFESGSYSVTNTSGQTIFSFGVSTFSGNGSTALGAPTGWSTQYYSAASWNSSFGQSLGLGTFTNTFGTTDTGVFFFASNTTGIASGETVGGFTYAASPSSQFVALGENNVLITSSLSPSTVPEPSSYAMMSLGLLGLGVVARRTRQTV